MLYGRSVHCFKRETVHKTSWSKMSFLKLKTFVGLKILIASSQY